MNIFIHVYFIFFQKQIFALILFISSYTILISLIYLFF